MQWHFKMTLATKCFKKSTRQYSIQFYEIMQILSISAFDSYNKVLEVIFKDISQLHVKKRKSLIKNQLLPR